MKRKSGFFRNFQTTGLRTAPCCETPRERCIRNCHLDGSLIIEIAQAILTSTGRTGVRSGSPLKCPGSARPHSRQRPLSSSPHCPSR